MGLVDILNFEYPNVIQNIDSKTWKIDQIGLKLNLQKLKGER